MTDPTLKPHSTKRGLKHFKNVPFLKALGQHCKRLRTQKGLSIDRLAKAGEQLSSSVIHRLENGSGAVTVLALLRYAEGLGLTLKELVDFSQELAYEGSSGMHAKALKLLSSTDPLVKEALYTKYWPVYRLREFADHSGRLEDMQPLGFLELPSDKAASFSDPRQGFILHIQGNAMVPQLKKDDFAVFSMNSGGGKDGRIVLVQHREGGDPEGEAGFSIRVYYASKVQSPDDPTSLKKQVTLAALNPDFEPIVLFPKSEAELRVWADFLFLL